MSFKYLFTISYTPHFFASVYGWYEEINTEYNNEIIHRTRTNRSNSTHVEEINPRIDRWARAWKIANNRPQLLSSFGVRNRKNNSNSSLVRALDIYGLLSQSFNFDTINYSYSVIYWIVLHIKVDMSMWKGELDCCGNSFCCSAFFFEKEKIDCEQYEKWLGEDDGGSTQVFSRCLDNAMQWMREGKKQSLNNCQANVCDRYWNPMASLTSKIYP